MYRWFIIVLAGLFMSACTHYLSDESLRLVNRTIPFSAVKQNPDNYLDSYLLVGGKIAKVTNSKEGGEIEVVQVDIESNGLPLGDFRNSEGRFLAQTGYFVDPVVYKEGMLVSMVGQVKGKKVQPLVAVSYTYPLLAVRELRLWQPDELYHYYAPYPTYNTYFYPYDYPYNYGLCDFGFGPYPYYGGWGRDRCFLYNRYYFSPPYFFEPGRRRHVRPPPAAGKPKKSRRESRPVSAEPKRPSRETSPPAAVEPKKSQTTEPRRKRGS